MPKKHTLEEIISKLRQVDVLVAQGQSIATAVKAISEPSVQHLSL